ncbi:MAG: Ca-activated chloride channel family protein [Verrucomicrobiales bacterium]
MLEWNPRASGVSAQALAMRKRERRCRRRLKATLLRATNTLLKKEKSMIDLDTDPRLTAYALDELDREEREIFGQDMANADGNPEELIANIQLVAQMLDEVFAGEPELRMTEEQRASVLVGDGSGDALEVDEDGKVLPWVVRATIGKLEKAAVAERLQPSRGRRVGRLLLVSGLAACFVGGMIMITQQTLLDRTDGMVAMEPPAIEVESADLPYLPYPRPRHIELASPAPEPAFEPQTIATNVTSSIPVELGIVDESAASFDALAGAGGDFGAGFGSGDGGGGGLMRTSIPASRESTPTWMGSGHEQSGAFRVKRQAGSTITSAELAKLRSTVANLEGLDGDLLVKTAVDLAVTSPTLQNRFPDYETEKLKLQALRGSGLGAGHPKVIESEGMIEMLQKMLVDSVRSSERSLKTRIAIFERNPEAVRGAPSQEAYDKIIENQYNDVVEGNNQLSTFSIDVDTASYANIRRMLRAGQKPPAAAVRIEEMVNYFNYAYPQPEGKRPFSANLEVASCPWEKGHRLVRIGLKGREKSADERPNSNLVFLIDVSGSMQSANKLSLLKVSMMGLVKNLREQDSVAIVAYAGNSGLVLDSTSGALQDELLSAIGRLEAGGSTNGGAGIQLAYRVAKENFIKGGVNRVILATDGDFNVGITDQNELVKMVAERAKENVFLTVLGFGSGNLKDDLIEKISNRGNGNSFYIDTAREGHKVLVEEMGATLETIAKDVKIQVEFNPSKVQSYRLIGYENRRLRNRDFNDDKIDAGEVGAGHSVTAMYEIVPVGAAGAVDELRYAPGREVRKANGSQELLTVTMRYKQPEGTKSVKFDAPLVDTGNGWEQSSGDFRFAASVAGFGMLLRDSEFKGELSFELVEELAGEGIGADPKGYRKEFLELLELARRIGR